MDGVGHLNQQGVSLTEVLVALAILALVSVVFLGGVSMSINSNGTSRTHISAESVARDELEYVKAKPYYNTPWSYTLPGTPPSWDPSHSSLPATYSGYTVSVSGSSIVGYNTDIQQVTATVSYNGAWVLSISAFRVR